MSRTVICGLPVRQKQYNPVKLTEISDPSAVADTGFVYTNDTATGTELMYLDDAGAEVQITANGFLNAAAIGGGTANRVVVTNGTGAFVQDAELTYDTTTNVLGVGGGLSVRTGSAGTATGSIYGTSDTNTSIDWLTGDAMQITLGGTATWSFATTGTTTTLPLLIPTGTSSAPSITESGSAGTYGFSFIGSAGPSIHGDGIRFYSDSNNLYAMLFSPATSLNGYVSAFNSPSNLNPSGSADCIFMRFAASFVQAAADGVSDLFRLTPTYNLTTGSSTGRASALFINPTITALNAPSGANNVNGAIILASTAALGGTSGLGGLVMFNTSNVTSARENARAWWTSNEFTIQTENNGASSRGITLTTADDPAAAIATKLLATSTITGGVTDGYTGGLRLTPTYTAATAQTVTRHNYIDVNNVTLAGAGPAALTNGCFARFNAAAGTHCAVDGSSTKVTVTAVDAWVKVNVNGTVMFMPVYASKTA